MRGERPSEHVEKRIRVAPVARKKDGPLRGKDGLPYLAAVLVDLERVSSFPTCMPRSLRIRLQQGRRSESISVEIGRRAGQRPSLRRLSMPVDPGLVTGRSLGQRAQIRQSRYASAHGTADDFVLRLHEFDATTGQCDNVEVTLGKLGW